MRVARGADGAPRHACTCGSRSTTGDGPRSSHAARRLVEDGLEPAQIDEEALAARLYAPELGDVDLLIRTSGELRISNFLLWEAAYAELVFTDTLWPDFDAADLRAAVDAYARAPAALRGPHRVVSPFVSRIAVAAVLLPLVLGIVWLGGWWLFGLALVGGLLALHELYAISRGLRPIVLGRLRGPRPHAPRRAARGPDVGARGHPRDARPRRSSCSSSRAPRQSAVAGFAVTLLGVGWVGGGLAHLAAAPRHPGRRPPADLHDAAHRVRRRHRRVLRRARDRASPPRARDLAGEVVGGLRRRARSPASPSRSSRSTSRTSSRRESRSCSGSRSRSPRRSATCSSPR